MASPQSSVDMDISDGSDLDQASHSSDMEVSNNSDDEIAYNTSNNNVLNTNVSHAEQMRISPSNNYYYKPSSSSYPRVYEVTNQNTASLYTQDVPPDVESYYTTQAPVVTEGYSYYNNYQQPMNVSSSTFPHHEQQSMYYNSVNQTSLPMDSTMGTATTHQSNVIEAFAAVAIKDQDKKQEDQVMNDDDDDDTDSLSSYVTAPLYTVNESEEEGLIGDEDEDDMETLGWYKHLVHKLDTEIDKTKKSKRALEEDVLRLQIKLSVEKNKINSIMKKKNDKKKKMMDKGKKKMKSRAVTSIVPEEQPVTKKNSLASPAVTSFSYKSTSSSMPQKQPPTSTPITSNVSSSTLQKPVETTKTTISKPASPLTVSPPSLPLPSASGIVKTNKPIKSKDTPSSSISPLVSNPMIQKSTVSTPSSTGSTIPSTMPSKVSTSITSSKPSSSTTSFNKPNTLTNLKKTSSNMTPPTRVNAITQRKSSSIHPAPKIGIQHHSKGAFKPYESPLRRFGFSHMDTKENGIKNNDKNMMSSGIIISSNGVSNNHSNNNNDVDNDNSGDMNRALCRYETVGGTCNDDTCQALHFRDFQ